MTSNPSPLLSVLLLHTLTIYPFVQLSLVPVHTAFSHQGAAGPCDTLSPFFSLSLSLSLSDSLTHLHLLSRTQSACVCMWVLVVPMCVHPNPKERGITDSLQL